MLSFTKSLTFVLVELNAAKLHTVLYQINRTEYYCQVDLPLSALCSCKAYVSHFDLMVYQENG